ncbi:hypothetical protein, partial [Pseudomonas amygdali]|uniref:hypothetical protein n=1 Tax=Pseudomonas amygdali TaxID=47877 RepID=UPI001F22977A
FFSVSLDAKKPRLIGKYRTFVRPNIKLLEGELYGLRIVKSICHFFGQLSRIIYKLSKGIQGRVILSP